jgi:photosystem II stability/assembly factor-like uncharacterized protein
MADIKKGDTVVLAGTKKGLFVFHSRDRKKWKTRGPYHEGYPIQHAVLDPSDGKTLYAGVTSFHWGTRVVRSGNFGARWTKGKDGPHYSKESGLSVDKIWQVKTDDEGTLYAGVEPAGLFRSKDRGDSWKSVDGLNGRPERKDWQAGNGGLCLHTVLPYPGDPSKMVVGISSVGVFGTKDGGETWKVMNGGIHGVFEPDKVMKDGEIGTCPHKIARDGSDPRILYQQNHAGVYRRAEGDNKWVGSESGLPRTRVEKGRRWTFGFPVVGHPSKRGWAYLVPLQSDYNRVGIDGGLAVWRTKDGGRKWQKVSKGLPTKHTFLTVLRDGARADPNDPAGIYIGTTNGQIYSSRDDGDSWGLMAENLPGILSIEAGVVGG